MIIIERVQKRLKPKVKQFGFTKKVLKSVAAEIANKLEIAEDASDEDADAQVDNAIETALPYLSLIQSRANELHEEWKKSLQKDDENDDDDDSEEGEESPTRSNHQNKSTKTKKKEEDMPKWAKALLDSNELLKSEVASLKSEKVSNTRRSRLESLLKDSGTFGKRTLKSFAKMNFKDDDEFDEFFSEVEEDLKALNQERADAGLSSMGNPPGGKGDKQEKREEAFSDAEIDAMAE